MRGFAFALGFVLCATSIFNFVFAGTTVQGAVSFDGSRVPFDQTPEGKAYIQKFGRPALSDAFGYPMARTPLKQQASRYRKAIIPALPKPALKPGPKLLPVKKNPNIKTTSLLRSFFDFFISSAAAFDEDPNVPGLFNCRSSISTDPNYQPGYFKAYFEDVAYNNGAGSLRGYHHPTYGYDRRREACEVLEQIGILLMLDQHGGPTPEILFTREWPADSSPYALASASPYYSFFDTNGLLHQHIISKSDPAAGPDAFVNTNWQDGFDNPSILWSVDSALSPATYDFKTALRHEVLHALGFMSRLNATVQATQVPVYHTKFDEFLFSPTTSYFTSGPNQLLQAPTGSPSPWYINNASTYVGTKNYIGAPQDPERPLYTPGVWQQGSSLSHFDMNRLAQLPNGLPYVMHPSISRGLERNIHDHEKEVLCHLGYQVAGLTGCTGGTPMANNDQGLITATSFCVDFLANDFPGNITSTGTSPNLGLSSLTVEEPSVAYQSNIYISFYSGIGCTGSLGEVTLNNAQSFVASATTPVKSLAIYLGTSVNSLVFQYQLKDYVTGSSYKRTSNTAKIVYNLCSSPADEFVCNGNFEMGAPYVPSWDLTFTNYNVPFWAGAKSAADIAVKNNPNYPHSEDNLPIPSMIPAGMNTGNAQGGAYSVDMVDGGSYAALLAASNNFAGTAQSLRITTKLKAKLTVGQCYKLSLNVASIQDGYSVLTQPQSNIRVRFSTTNLDVDTGVLGTTLHPTMEAAFTIMNQMIDSSPYTPGAITPAEWRSPVQYFTAFDAFESLAIDVTNTPTVPYNFRVWVDNVSLKQVPAASCSSSGSISGYVYNDISGDHQMSLGEQVLPGVPVSLFDASGARLDTLTGQNGQYMFSGLSPANSYVVVVNPESTLNTITEPSQNSIQPGYQYARLVPFTGGVAVTGENFGFLFNGQTTSALPVVSTQEVCNGVKLIATFNAAGPNSYSWTGPAGFTSTLPSPVVTTPGTYSVTVGGPGYVGTAQVTVTSAQLPQLSGSVAMTATSVSINTSFSGPTPTTYAWTGPAGSNYTSTQPNATGITLPGTYTVTVTYGNSCQKQATFTVAPSCSAAPPASAFATILNSTNNVPVFNCYATLAPNGTRQCVYNKVPSSASNSTWYTACPAAVAGTNCCGWYDACPPMTLTGVPTNATSGANGGLTLTVSGTGPFTYLWSNGQTSQNLTNVAPGSYSVVVKNTNGCQAQATFLVQSQLVVSLTKNQGCKQADNSITSSVSGGLAPHTYKWFKNGAVYPSTAAPATTPSISNLSAGAYSLSVTDANQQVVSSASVSIDAYTTPVLTVVTTDATGPAFNNGSIKGTVSGGLAPFTYQFSDISSPIAVPASPYTRTGISGSSGMFYNLVVKDSKGCFTNTVSGIKILNKLTATSAVAASCSATTSAPMIVVNAIGGSGSLSYEWKQGTTVISTAGAALSGVPAGTYTVTVRDQSTPTPQSVTLNVTMPTTAPTLSATTSVVHTTNGLANGSVTVNATAGLGPYTFTYTPGTSYPNLASNSHTQGSLAAGTYSVNVKTFYGCSFSKSFTINPSATTVPATSLK